MATQVNLDQLKALIDSLPADQKAALGIGVKKKQYKISKTVKASVEPDPESEYGESIVIRMPFNRDGRPTFKRGEDGKKDESQPTGNTSHVSTGVNAVVYIEGFGLLKLGCNGWQEPDMK